MTTSQQIQFAASVQVGMQIEMGNDSVLTVTKIGKHSFVGTLKVKCRQINDEYLLTFQTISNPHYNKHLRIL
jgi:hypothetical protein